MLPMRQYKDEAEVSNGHGQWEDGRVRQQQAQELQQRSQQRATVSGAAAAASACPHPWRAPSRVSSARAADAFINTPPPSGDVTPEKMRTEIRCRLQAGYPHLLLGFLKVL